VTRPFLDAYDAVLAPEELARRLAMAYAELDGEEGQHMAELVAWFVRKYPTALDRVRFAARQARAADRLRKAGGG
jgi:hypothetical protein